MTVEESCCKVTSSYMNDASPSVLRLRLALWALCFAVADQSIKWVVNEQFIPETPYPVLPGVFQLTLTYNTGAAFSLFNHAPQLLTGFSLLLFALLLGYSFSRKQYRKGEPLALALLIGGALGNLVDRIQYGRVTDFLDLTFIHYPIFNGADIFIFLGALFLLLIHWRTDSVE